MFAFCFYSQFANRIKAHRSSYAWYSENLSEDYIYFKQEKLWIVKFLVPIQDKESYIRLMVVYLIQPPLKFCIFIDVTISGEWNSLDYTKRLWPLEKLKRYPLVTYLTNSESNDVLFDIQAKLFKQESIIYKWSKIEDFLIKTNNQLILAVVVEQLKYCTLGVNTNHYST